MDNLSEKDLVADIRDRVLSALKELISKFPVLDKQFKKLGKDLLETVAGQMSFQVRDIRERDKVKEKFWKSADDYDRIEKFTDTEASDEKIVFKLGLDSLDNADDVEHKEYLGYDCYSIYSHSDGSKEWRLCKIVRTELKKEFNIRKFSHDFNDEVVFDYSSYAYFVEFLHLRKQGKKDAQFQRNIKEVIMSARYLREQQVNFEQQNIAYIRKMYDITSDLGPKYAHRLSRRPSLSYKRINQNIKAP